MSFSDYWSKTTKILLGEKTMENQSEKETNQETSLVKRNHDTETQIVKLGETNSQFEIKDKDGNWTVIDLDCPKCNSNDNVFCEDDSETCYCVRCGVTFNGWDVLKGETREIVTESQSALEAELAGKLADAILAGDTQKQIEVEAELIARNDANKAAIKDKEEKDKLADKGKDFVTSVGYTKDTSTKYNSTGYDWKKSCVHMPKEIISARGWSVWGGKKEDVKHRLTDFDLVLNLANYGPVKQTHVIPIPELKEFENFDSFTEVQLDWPDFGTITLPREFWDKLIAYIRTNNQKTLVFCQGGHGRTGTALACLIVCSMNWTAQDAIDWIRKNYCSSAIETYEQRLYIEKIWKDGLTDNELVAIKQAEDVKALSEKKDPNKRHGKDCRCCDCVNYTERDTSQLNLYRSYSD